MLQCAKPKGQPKFKYRNKYFENNHTGKDKVKEDSSEAEELDEYEEIRLKRKRSCICCCCCPQYSCCKGDRLINFLIYDFICLAGIIGYLCYYIFGLHKL